MQAGDAEVKLGTRFVAYCHDWQRGWVKFVDGELVEKRIGRVADRFVVVERDELDELDKIGTTDEDGNCADPWTRQDYLPLENAETGERFVFVTSTNGGRIGVEILCQRWARNLKKGANRGLPTIKLALGEFHTKKWGAVPRPDFPIVAWEDEAGALLGITPPSLRQTKPAAWEEDEEEGPPSDEGDPGFDEELIR